MELVEILNEAAKAYYTSEKEIMTNFEYDALYDELENLEKVNCKNEISGKQGIWNIEL